MGEELRSGATVIGPPSAAEVCAALEQARVESAPSAGQGASAPPRRRRRGQPLVGVVSLARRSTTGPFWQPLLGATCWRLLRDGYEPLRHDVAAADGEVLLPESLVGAAGLIVVGASGRDEPLLQPLLAGPTPVVLVDFDLIGKRVAHVMSNNLEGMAAVVRHLFRLGRRRIATLAGPSWTLPGSDRLLGYRSAISALGLEGREEYVLEGYFGHAEGRAGAQALLALAEPPDAIAAASDTLAVGAIAALERAGLRVPEDVAVTGFDDVGFARRMRPALTTVRQNLSGLAAAAVDALVTMIADPLAAPPATLLPTELMVRESSGAGRPQV